MSKELTIPYDVADKIAVTVLEEHYNYLVQELRAHKVEGKWLHPEDAIKSQDELIPALKVLIKYFGGEI